MLEDTVLAQLVAPYGLRAEEAEFLRNSQNAVYRFDNQAGSRIIRIAANRHQSAGMVEAELKWIERLSQAGFQVNRPVAASDGRLVCQQRINDRTFLTTCFEHVPGVQVARRLADEEFFTRLGILVGRLHAFACSDRDWQSKLDRLQWHGSRLLNDDVREVEGLIDPAFAPALRTLMSDLETQSLQTGGVGLIHGDVGFGNIFDNGKSLWLIDFDNCEFGHFLQDLSVVLYDSIYYKALLDCPGQDTFSAMRLYWHAFLEGYMAHTPLKEIDGEHLARYFLLREALLYVYFWRVTTPGQRDESFYAGQAEKVQNLIKRTHAIDVRALMRRA